jgi:hypothetical protein
VSFGAAIAHYLEDHREWATLFAVLAFMCIAKSITPPNAEVSDGGGQRVAEYANACRPPPFARPKS